MDTKHSKTDDFNRTGLAWGSFQTLLGGHAFSCAPENAYAVFGC